VIVAAHVRLIDQLLGSPATITMADVQRDRFYRQALRQNHRAPSITELIASAPSPFAVEGLLDDFQRFVHGASPKTRAQVDETARVRLCELRGVLP
jgi:hypothetical protein